eukprot:1667163-Amphidinium_carterae.1
MPPWIYTDAASEPSELGLVVSIGGVLFESLQWPSTQPLAFFAKGSYRLKSIRIGLRISCR